MDIRQLEYFLAIVDSGGFSRAAVRSLYGESVAPPTAHPLVRGELERGALPADARRSPRRFLEEALLPHKRLAESGALRARA
ncbi:hypothetical protein [Streptomyces sp. NPDC016845]|uniref:hypothetical protein n=1 Tax=Streptomyces sp. NPDC016845 TaxID=3364972 RepID=UPI0037B4D420